MNIEVRREACCSQDDQLGPLETELELPDDCTLAEFVQAVFDSRFLQFSSTHTEMSCRIGTQGEVARVFSRDLWRARQPVFRLDPKSLIAQLAATGLISFVFDKN